jgi:hypothetical protein
VFDTATAAPMLAATAIRDTLREAALNERA